MVDVDSDETVSLSEKEAEGEIDVTEIMQRIKERIHQERQLKDYDSATLPTFIPAATPQKSTYHRDAEALQSHLQHLQQYQEPVAINPNLSDSTVAKWPIIGPLWHKIRQQAHHLVLFYVNRVIAEQSAVNKHLVRSLDLLTKQNLLLKQQLNDLQDEIATLQKQVNM